MKLQYSIYLFISLMLVSSASMANEFVINQKNKSFRISGNKVEQINIKVGDVLRFKNEDPFFHNIFSLSDLKIYDLGSYPRGQSKSVAYDKAGTAEVECAIHPRMYLKVIVE